MQEHASVTRALVRPTWPSHVLRGIDDHAHRFYAGSVVSRPRSCRFDGSGAFSPKTVSAGGEPSCHRSRGQASAWVSIEGTRLELTAEPTRSRGSAAVAPSREAFMPRRAATS
ncbi:MAG TPA: hypothetical protein VHT91_34715 [Kofleriaceae bacterium]|jgi:hypothetical protein|nr:hypothetical protein [Kofleriaceae bacterium]